LRRVCGLFQKEKEKKNEFTKIIGLVYDANTKNYTATLLKKAILSVIPPMLVMGGVI